MENNEILKHFETLPDHRQRVGGGEPVGIGANHGLGQKQRDHSNPATD